LAPNGRVKLIFEQSSENFTQTAKPQTFSGIKSSFADDTSVEQMVGISTQDAIVKCVEHQVCRL